MTARQSRGKTKRKTSHKNTGMITVGAAVILALAALFLFFRGCAFPHRSPESIVQALVRAGATGNQKDMKDCYGIKGDAPSDLQVELDATIRYYKAHNCKKVRMGKSGRLYQDGDLTCVYIFYSLRLEDGQDYPCAASFMTQKREGRYYVLTAAQITEDMSQMAAEAYKSFMETDAYKTYAKEYDTFIRKNPGYEDKIAGKLN